MANIDSCKKIDFNNQDQSSEYKSKVDTIWNSKDEKKVKKALEWLIKQSKCNEKAFTELENILRNNQNPIVHKRVLKHFMKNKINNELTINCVVDVVFQGGKGKYIDESKRVDHMKWLLKNHPEHAKTKHTIDHHLSSLVKSDDPVKVYLQKTLK